MVNSKSLNSSGQNYFRLTLSHRMFGLGCPDWFENPAEAIRFVTSWMRTTGSPRMALLGSVKVCLQRVNSVFEKKGSVAHLPFVVFHTLIGTKH